eukprot:2254008-Amphidinium_carterae.2
MRRWYGHVCVVKTDVKSAFDSVTWPSLVKSLSKRGIPSSLIDVILQSQIAGFRMEYDGTRSQLVLVPTRGVRQGCRFGPVLFRLVLEDVLEPLSASWHWGPRSLNKGRPVLGTEVFGPCANTDAKLHLLVFADDIYIVLSTWFEAVPAIQRLQNALHTEGLELALPKTEILCAIVVLLSYHELRAGMFNQ